MDQSLASRAPVALSTAASISPVAGSETGRARTVFLRVPDCSAKLESLAVDSSAGPPTVTWIERLANMTAGVFKGTWLPPRAWLVMSLGLAVVVAVVILRGAKSNDRKSSSAPTEVVVSAVKAPSGAADEAALDDAPRFSPGAQLQIGANQPAKLDTSRGGTSVLDKNTAPERRTLPGPTAHLEQRIDRVSTPY